MSKIKYILLIPILLLSAHLSAQVWSTDFEDEAERAQWTLNPVGRPSMYDELAHKWYIGQGGNHTPDGNYGLFISTDGIHAEYAAKNSKMVVAYRKMLLPQGKYSMYFDWRGQAQTGDGFAVCWLGNSVATNSGANYFPKWAYSVDPETSDSVLYSYNLSAAWTRGEYVFESTGDSAKLVIVWWSNGQQMVAPSGCIDNIEIYEYQADCLEPTNLKTRVINGGVEFSWTGTSDYYDVKAYDVQTGAWQIFDSVPAASTGKTHKITISGLTEGVSTLYVRSVCGEDTKSNFVEKNVFVFERGNRCIDYMDLSAKNCKVGSAKSSSFSAGYVDFGYENAESRHTLHYVPNEYDPRTEGQLKTVPDGYLASVRLGNWLTGAEAERITYSYRVTDASKSILKLKYACVLEDPEHVEEAQPRFTLNIRPVGECAAADFRAGFNMDDGSWHSIEIGPNNTLYWKDWTEVSVNLRDYIGKTLTIELTTYDCTQSGHYGYAYFVLDCENGEMSGLNCGEENPTTEFTAPDGFNYSWYHFDETGKLYDDGTNQTLIISPMDTLTYYVDVISKTNSQCYYTLTACGIPRFPVPDASYQQRIDNCENWVDFTNQSYIYYKNQVSDSTFTRSEGVERVEWDFGDGTISSDMTTVSHQYPREGGEFTVRLTAYIGNDECFVTKEIPLSLPSLDSARVEHISINGTCQIGEQTYTYYNSTEPDNPIIETYQTSNGCDVTVEVHVHETHFAYTDSLCEGGELVFANDTLTQTGQYVYNLQNQWGLDSIVTLDLYVEPMLQLSLTDTFVLCSDDDYFQVPYTIVQGKMQDIALRFDSAAVAAGFDSLYRFKPYDEIRISLPDDITPNKYFPTLVLGTEACPVPDIPLFIQVNYASSVVAQKDGVVALLNANHNGGYEFTSYQWYRNGEIVEEGTESYLRVTEGDVGAEYTVVVTRPDGVVLETCPMVYGGVVAVDNVWDKTHVYPTQLAQGETLFVRGAESVDIYDVTGRIVVNYKHKSPRDWQIELPISGVYFVRINVLNNYQTVKVIVK